MNFGTPETTWLLEHVDGENFSRVLDRSLTDAGASTYLAAELSGVDRPYLHRLRTGAKEHPSRQTVVRVGAALVRLGLDLVIIDELLAASGHLPIFVLNGLFPLTSEERQQIAKSKTKRKQNAKRR
jgi:hypothetical protein